VAIVGLVVISVGLLPKNLDQLLGRICNPIARTLNHCVDDRVFGLSGVSEIGPDPNDGKLILVFAIEISDFPSRTIIDLWAVQDTDKDIHLIEIRSAYLKNLLFVLGIRFVMRNKVIRPNNGYVLRDFLKFSFNTGKPGSFAFRE
jgi:hypothetical protein